MAKLASSLKQNRELTPEHVEWLVENRAATQRVSAKLFRLLKEHSNRLDDVAPQTQALVAIAFSLWRSAFLSDKTGSRRDTNQGAISFLSEMLQNNAIAYSQERTAKDWTFNYYVSNARYRLEELAENWPKSKIHPIYPAPGKRSPKNRWDYLQNSFSRAVDHFEKVLNRLDAV